ncbi:MAG: hypothetical protein JHC95_01645 [Solirubrobacteraceae bacterium]|nr:hypothetical protein [Solirubrobacteraceae bacterium]
MSRDCLLRVCLAGLAVVFLFPASAGAARLSFAMGEDLVSGASPLDDPPAGTYYTDARSRFGGDAAENAALDAVQAGGATLTFHLRHHRDFGSVPSDVASANRADALPTIRKIEERGIPWTAWLTVPYSDGYWTTERNGPQTLAAVRDFDAWARANGLAPSGVSLDLESSTADTKTFARAFRDPFATARTMTRNLGPNRQCVAARYLRDEVVGWLRRHGYSVVASVHPWVVDDVRNRDLAISDAMNLPVVMPGEFDSVGVMAMRSVFTGGGLPDPGPTLQSSYGRDARRAFGDSAHLVLGVPGFGPYGGPGGLRALIGDLRTAAASTTGSVGLFSLETVVRAYGGPAAIGQLIAATEDPLPGTASRPPSAATRFDRAVYQALDGVLGPLTRVAAGRPPTRWPNPC